MPDDVAAPLTPDDHNSAKGRWKYVYPVHSRRAGGLSIGINLNPGKECNWACAYCEVDGLVRGTPEAADTAQLHRELGELLTAAAAGDFGEGPVKDFSIAGDGEPTLSASFGEAVAAVARLREERGLAPTTRFVVITNGSRLHRAETQAAISALGRAGGEVWFKVDAGRAETRAELNGIEVPDDRIAANLATCARLAPTWIQTMAVHPHHGASETEALASLMARGADAAPAGSHLKGVLLYGLRRPSRQPGAEGLRALSSSELKGMADALRAGTSLHVEVFE